MDGYCDIITIKMLISVQFSRNMGEVVTLFFLEILINICHCFIESCFHSNYYILNLSVKLGHLDGCFSKQSLKVQMYNFKLSAGYFFKFKEIKNSIYCGNVEHFCVEVSRD